MSDGSTTSDLVALTRSLYDAVGRRDLDAVIAMYAREAVWNTSALGMEMAFVGREAIRGALEDLFAPYEALELVVKEIHDLGNGVAFSVIQFRGRLIHSSGFIERRNATVITWVDGLARSVAFYTDIDEARAAAEHLAEEGG